MINRYSENVDLFLTILGCECKIYVIQQAETALFFDIITKRKV